MSAQSEIDPPEANKLGELLLHLDAQRSCALQLIQRHNRFLATLLQQGGVIPESLSAPLPEISYSETSPSIPKPSRDEKGNVVSLFDYNKPADDIATDTVTPSTPSRHRVFDENDADARSQWGEKIDALLLSFGADDALAINRKQMAGTIFLASSVDGLFYFKGQSGVLFVTCFVGADENFSAALKELNAYAVETNQQINFMAQEARVDDLKTNGFSTTPIGIWQRIEPLSEYTLGGQKMRRLRYLVNKYTKGRECETIEYTPGTVAEKDKAICHVIDQWVALKEQNPPFIAVVKEQVMKGDFSKDHRFFLTYRDSTLDNVMVFSRDNFNDGYLMDLEFYAKDMPLGSTEFALNEIIQCFQAEKRKVVSLGLTMGTELFEHENQSEQVYKLFYQLRKADMLNGDANAQYKNKYRPQTTTMYLARPRGSGSSKLNDLMMLLGSG